MFDSFHHRDSVVLLQIARSRLDGSKDKWWIRLERTAGGDIAKLSHDQARIMDYGHEYEMAAEADFTEGLPFAHVLRVLDIIQEVSPNPTLIGSRLYASMLVEMLTLWADKKNIPVRWVQGTSMTARHYYEMQAPYHIQYYETSTQVRRLVESDFRRPTPEYNVISVGRVDEFHLRPRQEIGDIESRLAAFIPLALQQEGQGSTLQYGQTAFELGSHYHSGSISLIQASLAEASLSAELVQSANRHFIETSSQVRTSSACDTDDSNTFVTASLAPSSANSSIYADVSSTRPRTGSVDMVTIH